MKGRTYPIYKPSNADWMGEVPAHWGVDRLKWTVDFARNGVWGDEPDGGPEDIACMRVADFDRTNQTVAIEEPTIRKVRRSDQDGRLLQKGDLLLEKSGGGDGWPVGFVVEYTHELPAVCSNFIARMKPSAKVRSRYLRYLHHALYAARVNVRSIKQTSGIQNLDAASYLCELAPYPPTEEQDAIGTFLDRETAKIDALVAEQRTLIERLREKRQADITAIVTRGLNESARTQPSGMEWIGDIPESWQIMELRRLAKPGTSITYGIVQAGPEFAGGIPYIRTSDMAGDKLPLEGYPHTSPEIDESYARSRVEPGDIVVAIRATVGKPLIVPKELAGANLTQGTAKVCPGPWVLGSFLKYALESTSSQQRFEALSKGATFKEITLDMLRRFPIPVPPLEEQSIIVMHLDREMGVLKDLIAEAETSIALLQEHRSVLITAVATGKLDVRGIAS